MRVVEFIPLILWGFLVGFLGWGSCFRLSEPISNWLLSGKKSQSIIDVLTRAIVVVFLLYANFLTLTILPIFLRVIGEADDFNLVWRDMFGTLFISSLFGFFTWGFFRRLKYNN